MSGFKQVSKAQARRHMAVDERIERMAEAPLDLIRREEFVHEIATLWRSAQEKFLLIGRYLVQARNRLQHGEFQAMVENGWVTLSGSARWGYERSAAEDSTRYLSGVRGVTNGITLTPSVQPNDVRVVVPLTAIDCAMSEPRSVVAALASVACRVVVEWPSARM